MNTEQTVDKLTGDLQRRIEHGGAFQREDIFHIFATGEHINTA